MAPPRNEHDITRCVYLFLLFVGVLTCCVSHIFLTIRFPRITRESGILAQDREVEECCNGIKNLELWGPAVNWGTDFKLNSSKECCRACKAMCDSGDSPCLCNSWVFCGDREKCGLNLGECWLKKQNNPLKPEIKDSGDEVMWTSGLIFGEGEGIIALDSMYGNLHIKLFPDCAPHSVAYILQMLEGSFCFDCRFYRGEGRGSSWDSEGNHIADAPFGPPYALIQGILETQGIPFKEIPKEACPSIERGSVAWIGSGPEFLISLANHDEWKEAYTVFGSVLPVDMKIADRIAQHPSTIQTWRKTEVSILETPVSFSVRGIKKPKELI
ncbi:uncharacterized protein [Aristolochia californica]|uniref:uncharacterized protein n=1 Tax=Aristolochia californica TaxID=171875 RepID=UPI0035D5F48C